LNPSRLAATRTASCLGVREIPLVSVLAFFNGGCRGGAYAELVVGLNFNCGIRFSLTFASTGFKRPLSVVETRQDALFAQSVEIEGDLAAVSAAHGFH
jgi:hypothetical protein